MLVKHIHHSAFKGCSISRELCTLLESLTIILNTSELNNIYFFIFFFWLLKPIAYSVIEKLVQFL